MRAAAMILTATPDAVQAWCDSADVIRDEPMLAGAAAVAASYAAEHAGDLDRADAAATRMLAAFTAVPHRWMRLHAHSRIAEIAFQRADGRRAVEHYEAALRLTAVVRPRPDTGVLRLALAGALLQCGAVDDAERHLQQVAGHTDRDTETLPLAVAMRAEILLRRGQVERGLELWRAALDRWTSPLDAVYGDETVGPELLYAAAVLVHAHHGRLELVERFVPDLAAAARAALTTPSPQPLGHFTDARLVGTLLLALGRAELGHPGGAHSGVRLIALALRMGHLPFLPTMAAQPAEQAAIRADRAGYDAAREAYGHLDPEALRHAALGVLTTPRAASSARRSR
jgi:tetratricopeptide (TPR) repeat protein